MKKYFIALLATMSLFSIATVEAKISGKVDFGPAIAKMRLYSDKVLTRDKDLPGVKINGTFVVKEPETWYNGITFKPDFVYLKGSDEYASIGLGLGYFIPMSMVSESLKRLSISPHVGGSLGLRRADFANAPFGTANNTGTLAGKTTDRTSSVFVGMDLGFALTEKLYLSLVGNYKFVDLRTKAHDNVYSILTGVGAGGSANVPSLHTNVSSKGWSCGVVLDYYFNDNWSVNVAYGYEYAEKDKNSSKIEGYRIGAAYTF